MTFCGFDRQLSSPRLLLLTLAFGLSVFPATFAAQDAKSAMQSEVAQPGVVEPEATAPKSEPSKQATEREPEVKKTTTLDANSAAAPSTSNEPSTQAAAALKAIEQKNYAQALSLLSNDAEKNDPIGKYCLGILKLKGLGTEKNIEEGLSWLQQAAESGNVKAQMELGNFYIAGTDAPKDYKKAASFLQSAAEQGETQAQLELGKLYQQRDGSINDNTKAFQWFEKAAAKSSEAKRLLAECYQHGTGVGADPKEAFGWWKKAAEEGNIKAQQSIGRCHETGYGTTRYDKEAYKWFLKAASLNDAEAQNSLGCMYLEGRGVPKDKVQAISWLQKAANQGNKEAKRNLEDANTPSPIVCYKRFMAALYYAKSLRDILGYLTLEQQTAAAKMNPAQQQQVFQTFKSLYISNPKIAGEKIYGRMARIRIEGGETYKDGHEYNVFATEVELVLQNGFWRLTKSATNASRWE